MAPQRASRGHSVPERRHGSPGHARRRRVARPRPERTRRRRTVAPLHLGTARAADRGDPRRRDLRVRSQRHLAAARHGSRRRSRRARALLQRIRADGRHARVSQHRPRRAERRVRDCERRAGSHDDRQAQRQRAADFSRRTYVHGARLRLPPAESQRQSADRPRPRQRSAGQLRAEHAAARRPGSPVLRLPQRQAAARGVSGTDRRAADVDSARRQRVGDVAGLAATARGWVR